MLVLEATTGIEPVIELLQSPALPLGYVALIVRIINGFREHWQP